MNNKLGVNYTACETNVVLLYEQIYGQFLTSLTHWHRDFSQFIIKVKLSLNIKVLVNRFFYLLFSLIKF